MKKIYHNLVAGCCCMLLLLCVNSTFAQTKKISGKITAENNEPVTGATVQVKGTSTGTVTDVSGAFSLTVPENATLVVSFVGYKPQELTVGPGSVYNINLETSASALNELVVTGYTTQQRKDIIGAVSTVKAKELVAVPAGNAEQQLQGRVAGLTVLSSGQPGTTSLVRIRGFASFAGNEPLYIVDGVPTFSIENLNSFDIETTTVLKDAGSASIYGARASAGVIVITTKHGSRRNDGKIQVTYDGSYGWQTPGKGFDILNPEETAKWTWIAERNAGKVEANGNPTHPQYGTGVNPVLPDYILAGGKTGVFAGDPAIDPSKYNVDFNKGDIYQIVKANKAGTDWYDAITRTAPIQQHAVGLSGGSENSRFYAGFGYYNQEGVVLSTYLKRYSIRANSEFSIKNRVRIGENIQITFRDNPQLTNLNEGNAISLAYRMNPLIPVHDEFGGWAGTAAKGFNNPSNPVANQTRSKDNKGHAFGLFGNVYAEADLLKDLTFRSSFGGGLFSFYANGITSRTYENSENIGSDQLYESSGYGYSWTWTNTMRYEHTFGVNNIKALVGIEAIRDGAGRDMNGTGLNPFTNVVNYRTLTGTQSSGRTVGSEGSPGNDIFSIFGKVDYTLMDRYLISAVLRRDGSSNFGIANRYGTFPAVSAGWRVSQEEFLKGVSWINELKLRGGWGKMGNQRIDLNNQYNLYAASSSFSAYAIDGASTATFEGINKARIGNPEGRWETNITTNVGLDATLFNNTLDFIFDIYNKKTSNLLFNPELPGTVGQVTYPTINVASMSNKGIDMQLIKRGTFAKNWRYEANLTLTTYKNKITKLSEGVDYFDGNSFGSSRIGTFTRNAVGQPISAFFGYDVVGLFQDDNDVKNSAAQDGAAPGRFKYRDVDGDKKITANDRTFFGDPNPRVTSGLDITIGYKGFDFNVFLYAVTGAKVINYTRWFTDFFPSFPGQAISGRVRDSWTPENKGTNVPIFEDVSNFSTNTQPNSYYMENGAYLRARNVQLSYTLPASTIRTIGMEKLKIYVQAVNLFTITGYKGLDPAVSGVDTNFGVDYGNYPLTRQFILGLNAIF
jgi:TonB-linked SusC/RagA family outer membrane protein